MKRAVVLLIVLACSKSNELPSEAWGVEDYAKAGIAVDKPWGAAEFKNALDVLRPAVDGHRERLPRYRGAKSGAVFAKLVTDLPADADRPITDRFGLHYEHYDAVNQISKLYIVDLMAVPTREWMELMGALMREAAVLVTLSDDFIASFGPDDPKRQVRLDGLAKMKSGFGQMLRGGVLIAADLRVPEADRIAMVEHVTAVLPVLFPHVMPETQQAIRDHLAKLVAAVPAGKLHDAVVAAQKALP
jgi:hypothetical protein